MLCVYRKKCCTEHVLIKLIDSWKFTLDEHKYAGTVLMDLSKAFDCVSYVLLIAKMHVYGLSTNTCEFMSSYLSDTYQKVKISNVKSSWMPLQKGIPQGFKPWSFSVQYIYEWHILYYWLIWCCKLCWWQYINILLFLIWCKIKLFYLYLLCADAYSTSIATTNIHVSFLHLHLDHMKITWLWPPMGIHVFIHDLITLRQKKTWP